MVATATATKPGQDVNPNGFPSGEHYNLNIIGKKAGFTCPEPETDIYDNVIYGNVIFIPEDGNGIKIVMQSGKGKKAAAITKLQVIDPCTPAIDGDAAVLQLPKNEAGYHVYARTLGKPTESPDISIEPSLQLVEDENGNDLLYLGLVTNNGFQTSFFSMQRLKGKSKAVDITGLFLWSGDVCYFDNETVTDTKCCIDSDSDGIYEGCTDYIIVDGIEVCPDGYDDINLNCVSYSDEWVFNIADFVEYLWDLKNNGLKLLQIRFYPN